uniref:Putative tick cistatins 1 n=1 Tax=Rhipicephalus microplus TaxID=6941 RepID=A0A6M2DB45_RHIMP
MKLSIATAVAALCALLALGSAALLGAPMKHDAKDFENYLDEAHSMAATQVDGREFYEAVVEIPEAETQMPIHMKPVLGLYRTRKTSYRRSRNRQDALLRCFQKMPRRPLDFDRTTVLRSSHHKLFTRAGLTIQTCLRSGMPAFSWMTYKSHSSTNAVCERWPKCRMFCARVVLTLSILPFPYP